MKITKVSWIRVRVGCLPGSINSPEWGEDTWPSLPRFIVFLHTDDGIIGIGETHRGVTEEAVRFCAERIQGKDPLALCWQSLPFAPDEHSMPVGWRSVSYPGRTYELSAPPHPAYAAFETAVFDIVGKALNLPVCQLLGGAHTDVVPVQYWTGRQNSDAMREHVRKALALGYRAMKIKSAAEDPVVAQVEAIAAEGGPGFSIVVDPNQRFYRLAEAARLARSLEHLPNSIVFEEPMPQDRVDWYRLFRTKSAIPVAHHVFTPTQAYASVASGGADYLNVGGWSMTGFVRAAAIAEASGTLVWHGSGVDLGILEASYVHAAAAARSCVLPSDIFGRLVRQHDLLVEPLRIYDGTVAVPSGPGLGVTLDYDAVERYRVRN